MTTRLQGIPDLVYDVGMNIGEDTPYYLAKGFRVVAIEANPLMVERALTRFAPDIEANRLTVVQGAIAQSPGRIRFFVCDTMSAWSTTDLSIVEQHKRAGAIFHEVMVEAIPFADVLRKYGVPHYLKVDIEGCDLLCVKALSEFSERPGALSVEVNLFDHQKLLKSASALGYKRFQIIAQSSIPEQRVPIPAREGRDVDYRFVCGCSGLFGAELPDSWRSADETLATLNSLLWQHRAVGASRVVGKLFGVAEDAVKLGRKVFPRTNDWYDLHMM